MLQNRFMMLHNKLQETTNGFIMVQNKLNRSEKSCSELTEEASGLKEIVRLRDGEKQAMTAKHGEEIAGLRSRYQQEVSEMQATISDLRTQVSTASPDPANIRELHELRAKCKSKDEEILRLRKWWGFSEAANRLRPSESIDPLFRKTGLSPCGKTGPDFPLGDKGLGLEIKPPDVRLEA